MTEDPIIQKPVLCNSIDWFIYDRDLRYERAEEKLIVTMPNKGNEFKQQREANDILKQNAEKWPNVL